VTVLEIGTALLLIALQLSFEKRTVVADDSPEPPLRMVSELHGIPALVRPQQLRVYLTHMS